MSETLAEEEKQRIRVELMTEIAKNEQDLEQCNEETGRYGREFLYNIRDLEQLCSITECPLTSHELQEFGIFPKKKNLFNRLWTHVKDIVTRPHKAEEEAARIAREKAEIVDIMNRLKEQSRRSEKARIERDRIVKEQTERQREKEERQIRENAAHLEKERTEKEELEARIKMMEEQMRRSEEARLEMERWIEKEKERKIKKEEEKRFREEEARIEKEKAEAEVRERQDEEDRRIFALRETSASKIQNYYRGWKFIVKAKEELNERRNRKEKERIEKEEEDRKRKVVEERRLRIEADVNSLLALPYELRMQAYRDFDLKKRRELRINEELAEIELKAKYRYEWVIIKRKKDIVELSVRDWIESAWCHDVFIPISEIGKEFEIMGKNTQFDCIQYTAKSGDGQIINGMKSIKAKHIHVYSDSNLNDADLRSIVENKEKVMILSSSSITVNGLMWIYENMRDRNVGLKEGWITINETERWKFLDNLGNFDRESLTFTGSNHNHKVRHDDEDVIIVQDKLVITVRKKDESYEIGYILFHFNR